MTRAILLAAAWGTVCAQGGSTALLRPVCGPTDAPAVQLELPAARGEPQFRLRFDGPASALAGHDVTVRGTGDPHFYPQWCNADGCDPIRSETATTATFGRFRDDSTLTVRLRTTAPDGKPFAWEGVARWRDERLVCG